jgi:DNA-binding transcriptional regulator YiaG
MSYKGETIMERDKDAQITGTMSDYLVERLESEEHGHEYAVEYLKADFLAAAAISLSTLRREAGLTQAQVAECLHTKQSAIARLEADFDGSMTLRRYVDFVLACGFIPHQLTFTPIEIAHTFKIAQPATALTFENQSNWSNPAFQMTLEPNDTTHMVFRVSLYATTLQEEGPELTFHGTSVTFDSSKTTTVQEVKSRSGTTGGWSQILASQESAA